MILTLTNRTNTQTATELELVIIGRPLKVRIKIPKDAGKMDVKLRFHRIGEIDRFDFSCLDRLKKMYTLLQKSRHKLLLINNSNPTIYLPLSEEHRPTPETDPTPNRTPIKLQA